MKNKHLICFVGILMLGLGACKKDASTDNLSAPNVVTLDIDGKQYTATGNKSGTGGYDRVESARLKFDNGTSAFYITIVVSDNGNSQFSMLLDATAGPANGIGSFKIDPEGSLAERFSGGEGYTIIGGNLTINKSEPKLIEGTLTMQVKNVNRTKRITGTFKITDPVF